MMNNMYSKHLTRTALRILKRDKTHAAISEDRAVRFTTWVYMVAIIGGLAVYFL